MCYMFLFLDLYFVFTHLCFQFYSVLVIMNLLSHCSYCFINVCRLFLVNIYSFGLGLWMCFLFCSCGCCWPVFKRSFDGLNISRSFYFVGGICRHNVQGTFRQRTKAMLLPKLTWKQTRRSIHRTCIQVYKETNQSKTEPKQCRWPIKQQKALRQRRCVKAVYRINSQQKKKKNYIRRHYQCVILM